jgi:cell division protein FtsX
VLSLLSITTIAFSLFAFGLFSLVALNIRSTLRALESRVEIRAFLGDSSSTDAVAAAMDDIAKYPEVLRVEYVTPEQALVRARKELGEFNDVFEAGFLPGSIDIRLRDGFRDPPTVKRIAELLPADHYMIRTPVHAGEILGGRIRHFGMLRDNRTIGAGTAVETGCPIRESYIGIAYD